MSDYRSFSIPFPTNLHTGCFQSPDTTLRVVIPCGKISRKEVILFHLRLRFPKKETMKLKVHFRI